MKISVASTCLWKLTPEESIKFAEKNGLYSIEFWIDHLAQYRLNYKDLKRLLKNAGISSTVHSISWDINISSFSKDVREFSIKEVKKSIDIASEIESELIVFHPGRMSFTAAGREVFFKILIESIISIYKYARNKGVKICIENMEPLKKELLVTEKDFETLYSRLNLEDIYITMDVAHLGSLKKVKDFYQSMKERIAHIHISDVLNENIHIPLGTGDMPFKKIIALLKDEYRGIYNIEFFNYDPEAKVVKKSIDYLKKIL